MNTSKKMIAASIALALGMSSAANAAAQKEEDSAYEWGRWAVLSPAAGGVEPYVAAAEPGPEYNATPEIAEPFSPQIEQPPGPTTPPTVEAFCTAGFNCGYATYYKDVDEDGPEFEPEAAVEGYDQSDNNPGGPVLARFSLDASPLDQPDEGPGDNGDTDFEPTAVAGGQDGEPQIVNYEVFGTNDADFPDIESAEMEGTNRYSGTEQTVVRDRTENGDPRTVRTIQTSTLNEEQHDFNVDTGLWGEDERTQTRVNTGEPSETIFDFFSAGGHFAFGRTATIDEMQRFAAGNVTAVYQGVVLDYNSRVTMEFNLRNDTVVGRFASENGFNGFEAAGAVDGVNFSAKDGANGFVGSFFSGGENVSGAVKNATQLGVYSADHVRRRR